MIFRTISIGIRFQSLLLQPVEKMSDLGSTVIKYDGKNVVISYHCAVFANENPKSGILHISICILLDSDGGEAHVLPSVNRSVAASCCPFRATEYPQTERQKPVAVRRIKSTSRTASTIVGRTCGMDVQQHTGESQPFVQCCMVQWFQDAARDKMFRDSRGLLVF